MNIEERKFLKLMIDQYESTYSLETYKNRDIEVHTNEFIKLIELKLKEVIEPVRYNEIYEEARIEIVMAANRISNNLNN
ncbi:hypothetical protein [Aquimarina algiphila]|uniref:hypothetical protein n=1 Tax=Aquimarina algiphila TaxID=2047982 RepID=UPI002491C97E|nr:hypothetical protein [Aquimarina algiphila]